MKGRVGQGVKLPHVLLWDRMSSKSCLQTYSFLERYPEITFLFSASSPPPNKQEPNRHGVRRSSFGDSPLGGADRWGVYSGEAEDQEERIWWICEAGVGLDSESVPGRVQDLSKSTDIKISLRILRKSKHVQIGPHMPTCHLGGVGSLRTWLAEWDIWDLLSVIGCSGRFCTMEYVNVTLTWWRWKC